jgi:hypothetical protein
MVGWDSPSFLTISATFNSPLFWSSSSICCRTGWPIALKNDGKQKLPIIYSFIFFDEYDLNILLDPNYVKLCP